VTYNEHGEKIVGSADSDAIVVIDFSKFTDRWSNVTNETQMSRSGNGNGLNGNGNQNGNGSHSGSPDWSAFAHSLPKQDPTATATAPTDLKFEKDVLATIRHMDVVDEAKNRRNERDREPFEEPEIFDGETFLEQPDNPTYYKVQDLWPVGGNVLFAAPAKFGKSTVMMNLIRSLLDGTAFLGSFDCQQIPEDETLLLIDLEMSTDRVRAEVRAQKIQNVKRLRAASLRGAAKKFDITDPEVREYWTDYCQTHNVKTLILDPLAPLLGFLNTDENDNTMVNRFFQQLDEFKLEAGIRDMIVVHHCGHMADFRPRGASRFNDWPDALWGAKIDGDVTDPTSPRLFHARGRDVGENLGGPGKIERDPNNLKILNFKEGSGNNQAEIDAIGKLDNWIFSNQGKSTKEILEWAARVNGQGVKNIDFAANKIRDLLKGMVDRGQIHVCTYKKGGGAGAPADHYASDTAHCSKTPPCQD
jgi:hypothetical protein